MNSHRPRLALVLGGGGARAAYQAGFLRGLTEAFPEISFPVLVGVSAGAINAAHLAGCNAPFPESVNRLVDLWRSLTVDQVFRTDLRATGSHMLRWAMRLVMGGTPVAPSARGMVDTEPLRDFLIQALNAPEGRLDSIEENLRSGRLAAVGITTTDYATGQAVTWTQGRNIAPWERPGRRSAPTTLTVDHVLASCALPLFFPGVQIDRHWHGDGGVQLTAPLSPALHLGADRILAISTRRSPGKREPDEGASFRYPAPAQIIGLLLDAIFLDMLDYDAQVLQRVNRLLRDHPAPPDPELRQVELLLLRPSQDLGLLANEFEEDLPRVFRFATRGLGTRETKRADLLATLLFQPGYINRVIEIGERDALARRNEIGTLLGL